MALTMQPFRVTADPAAVDDLRERLARTRWPDQIPGTAWEYGTDLTTVQQLCEHWRTSYDWAGYEARFNRFDHLTTDVDGVHLHAIHARSPEPGALPLLLLHGWPGSVAEMLDVIGPLADPAAHGGGGADAFHVVAPSLPGYGFSGPTTVTGVDVAVIARCVDALMAGLGYDRYVVQGGDWGAVIGTELGANHADRVAAIHLNLVMAGPPDRQDPLAGLDDDERAAVAAMATFRAEETGYQAIQGTKPQTLAYGLNDSPAGLAAWILEKFRTWSDCGGDLLSVFDPDRLLDNVSVYWLTGTIGSSMRLYREAGIAGGAGRATRAPKVVVPTGHAAFPGEIYRTPRSWAEARYPIHRWTVMPRGGHFPAMEVPDLLVDDVRAFFRDVRPGPRQA